MVTTTIHNIMMVMIFCAHGIMIHMSGSIALLVVCFVRSALSSVASQRLQPSCLQAQYSSFGMSGKESALRHLSHPC